MKNTMKKIGMIFSIVAMIVLFAVSANALDATGQCGDDIYWNFNSYTRELIISGEGDTYDYGWYKDTRSPFAGSNIKNVIITNGITSLGEYLFYECDAMTSVTISESITSIKSRAFGSTENLKEVYTNNIKSWVKIDFQSNPLEYGAILLVSDQTNDEIVIPNGVESIGNRAFYGCGNKTIVISKDVTNIGHSAFDSQYIQSITVDIENKYFSSRDGVLFNYDGTEIVDYPQGKNNTTYEIPYGVITVGQSAFSYCENLECIVLSQTVKHIEQSAFCYCSNIEKILISESLESIGSTAFYNCGKIIELDFSNTNLKHITDGAFSCCYGLKYMHLPNTLEYIGSGAFFTTYLDYIYFVGSSDEWESLVENYVDSDSPPYLQIPEKVFVDETHLKNVEIDVVDPTCTTEGVKTTNCLCGCGFTISEEIPVLEEHPYTKTVIKPTCTSSGYEKYVCSSCGHTYTSNYTPMLEHNYKDVFTVEPTCVSSGTKNIICSTCGYYKSSNVYVPSLGHIDENKDLYCDRENCKEAIESEPFTEGVYTYTIKDGKATIKRVDNTISGDVVIPSTLGGYPVTGIGYNAFEECAYLTSVTIPEGVTFIGEGAFMACANLTEIFLPESLKVIDEFAFGYCVSLTDISVPDTVTSIGNGAFAVCLSLKEFTMPENVDKISAGTFMYCFSLETLIINNVQTNFEAYICCTDLVLKDITVAEFAQKYKEAVMLIVSGNDEVAEEILNELEKHFVLLDDVQLLETVTIYSHDPSTAKTYAEENGIPFKNISELEEPHTCTFGEWFTETEPTVFNEGVSKRVCDCGKFETKPIAKLESAVTKDETTNIEITYTEENFETEVDLIVSEEEINANFAFGDEFENYKAYDISLVTDGEKVQPNGYVTVKLPIPEDFNADSTVVYYVAPDGTKTKLDSRAENGYVIFETNHFSEYVLVDESSKIEPPHEHSYTSAVTKNPTCTEAGVKTFTCSCNDSYTESIPALGHKDTNGDYKCDNGCGYEYEKPAPEEPADKNCSHLCHKSGFMGFIWKIINFFNKLFKSKQICDCGAKHW